MDSLDDGEFEGIWKRNKKYIELDKIKSISRKSIEEEIRQAVESSSSPRRGFNPQSNSSFLIRRGFHKRAAKTDFILKEILIENIKFLKVRNQPRFQLKKGSSTVRTPSGKIIKAGQFIKGKSREEALQNLLKKAEE